MRRLEQILREAVVIGGVPGVLVGLISIVAGEIGKSGNAETRRGRWAHRSQPSWLSINHTVPYIHTTPRTASAAAPPAWRPPACRRGAGSSTARRRGPTRTRRAPRGWASASPRRARRSPASTWPQRRPPRRRPPSSSARTRSPWRLPQRSRVLLVLLLGRWGKW